MAMFNSRKGVYRSKEETPSLRECLNAARSAVIYQYSIRAKPGDEFDPETAKQALEMYRSIAEQLNEPGCDATSIANLLNGTGVVRINGSFPEASDTTLIAAAYWLEANQLENSGDYDRSWTALLQCYFYIGAASGPFTHKEYSRLGAKRTKAPNVELKAKLIELLNELPEQSYKTAPAAIKAILPKAMAFRDQQIRKSGKRVRLGGNSGPDGAKGLIDLFEGWSYQRNTKVRAAFERVMVDHKFKSGRPPKSTIT